MAMIDEADQIDQDARPDFSTPQPRQVVAPPMVAPRPTAMVAPPGVAPIAPPALNPAVGYNPNQVAQDIEMRKMLLNMGDAPIAQAEAAVSTALKFQAVRGYQKDLAGGMAPNEALARWAPIMFTQPKASTLGQAGSFIKNTTPVVPKPMDIGGRGYLFDPKTRTMTAVTPPVTKDAKANAYDTEDYRSVLKRIEAAEKTLREDPEGSNADEIRNVYLPGLHAEANAIRARGRFPSPANAVPQAAPVAPAAPASDRVRVRRPDGKIGWIPASQLDAARKAGYTEAQSWPMK